MLAYVKNLYYIAADNSWEGKVKKQTYAINTKKALNRMYGHQQPQQHLPAENTNEMSHPENNIGCGQNPQSGILERFAEAFKIDIPKNEIKKGGSNNNFYESDNSRFH